MISVDDLQEKRSPEELDEFVQSTFAAIRADKDIRKTARLRKPPFKELIEEIYPLSIFCNVKYKEIAVNCCPVIGNQGFDARIETREGKLVEIVEITWPIDGQSMHAQGLQLNDKGYTDAEVWDVNDNKNRQEIIERIIEVANKKSVKDYNESEGSSLVFVVDIAPYFGMSKIEHPEGIEELKRQLEEIDYRVKEVYLLLLPINELIRIK
ncbi:MAG TPA: hypothetical protein ENH43_02020 [Phycisphaerales bacterium]|nr:hypothetical protein [Phycisphaerales bacterium]